MPHHIVVAINVVDEHRYESYRAAMLPILHHFGGCFGFDLLVSRVLRSPAPHPINRIFTIQFPSRAARESFFDDPQYRHARLAHFDAAVAGFTLIAEHDSAD